MKYFLRLVSVTVAAGATAFAPAAFSFELDNPQFSAFGDSPAIFASSNSGYLGVGLRDVDNERASALKLKEATGAEIVTVDHDAPAGAAGLKQHDVVLQMNGQAVSSAEQLRRMLRETPPGRAISLLISRDGQEQTINATLADHAALEQKAWSNLTIVPAPGDDGSSIVLQPPSSHSGGNSFFSAFSFGGASIGVQLDTLGSQLADYFGVKDGQGLLVKHVAENSPASTAGLKAGDVVTKVNGHTMATLNEWTKAMRANRGKQVQVVIMRNRQQQTLSMQDGDAKHKGELDLQEYFPDSKEMKSNLAQLDPDQLNPDQLIDPEQMKALQQDMQAWSTVDAEKLAEQAREQMKALQESQAFTSLDAEQLRQQAEQSLKQLNMDKFQQQLKDNSAQWRKQMDELKQEMQNWHWQEMN